MTDQAELIERLTREANHWSVIAHDLSPRLQAAEAENEQRCNEYNELTVRYAKAIARAIAAEARAENYRKSLERIADAFADGEKQP